MTETPIIDEIIRQTCECGRECRWPKCHELCRTHPDSAHKILRAANPWTPSAEDARPIMRELYPEKF